VQLSTTPRLAVPIALLAMLMAGCARPPEPTPVASQPVTNQALGIALATLPEAFVVATNQGSDLVLVPAGDEAGAASLTFALDAEGDSLNLVAAVERHQEEISSRQNGTYLGKTELAGTIGFAYLSRGRFEDAGRQLEESHIFALNPTGTRMMHLVYTYPAGDDSSARAQSLIEVLAAVEPAR
jgi:hypothetical protein